MEGIRRPPVLVLIAGTAIEQASSVGPQHIPSPSRLSGETSWIIALNYYIHVFFPGENNLFRTGFEHTTPRVRLFI